MGKISRPVASRSTAEKPRLIEGGLAVDDRGLVGFVNAFSFVGVKRFYWVANHKAGDIRAWHAHRHEAKYFTAVQGTVLVGAVKIDDWNKPSKRRQPWKFVLSAQDPSVLCVPPGYANGFMSLTDDAKLLVFSTATLQESEHDDIRYPPRYWDIWKLERR